MTENLRRQAGRLLMVGYEGDPKPVCAALSTGRVGGVILFTRNVESATQVREVTASFRAAAGGPVPVGIDQEGGRVARLEAAGLPAGPPARTIAQGGPEAAYKWGEQTGRFLLDLGIDVDFAPVLDVDTNPDNPIIGDRSWGTTPEQVIAFGREVIRGLKNAGVTPCGKHFPGHGDTLLDSHLALPVVDQPDARLKKIELAPFAALAGELPAIMTAHVIYPAWDKVIATLSHKIVSGLLKDDLGFCGVVVSDDLEMAAIADQMPVEERAVRSIEAGCDLLLICKQQELWERAHEALVTEAEKSPAFAARMKDAARRVTDNLFRV